MWRERYYPRSNSWNQCRWQLPCDSLQPTLPKHHQYKRSYLISSVSASCSSSSHSDEGRYRWSSETFAMSGFIRWACLWLSQRCVGVSGRRMHFRDVVMVRDASFQSDVIYSLPTIQIIQCGTGWYIKHNCNWTAVSFLLWEDPRKALIQTAVKTWTALVNLIQKECKTEKLSWQLEMKPELSTAVATQKPKEEFIPAWVDIIMETCKQCE